MKRFSLVVVLAVIVLPGLAGAETFDDWSAFQAAVAGDLTLIDFEGFAAGEGPEGARSLNL